jgi:phosphoribosylformylglycinamidine synthase
MLWTKTKTFQRNVAGMMPHPERASEEILGGDDGRMVLESMIAALEKKIVAKAA